jgi:hypothetical protein
MITAEKADTATRQQSRHNAAGATQTKGHARLVEIVREWQEKGQYYVTAKIAVDSEQEAVAKQDAGYFWTRIGKPVVVLNFAEDLDGTSRENQDDRTLRFFRDNLIHNGIMISSEVNPQYLIELFQVVQTKEMPALGTTTVHCHVSYKISDKERGTTVAEFKQSHGPDAGFSLDQAKEKCIGAVAPAVSENLVRKLAEVWNQTWNNGMEQTVMIDSLPGDAVPRADAIIQGLHRVTATTPAKYAEGQFIKNVTFKGEGAELAEAIRAAFDDENWLVTVTTVQGGRIRFSWKGTTEQ